MPPESADTGTRAGVRTEPRRSSARPDRRRYSASPSRDLAAATSVESSSAIPSAAGRSPPTPSTPPRRHRTGTGRGATTPAPASPSTYFSNSQPSRDLPTPAGPDTTTSRGVRRSAAAWNRSLISRSSASRPSQRRLQPVDPLLTADAGQHPGRPPQLLRMALPFRCAHRCREPHRRGRQPMRRLVHPHLPRRGRRLHPGRRVHRVARAMPSPTAPKVTATSPVTTPARAARARTPARSPNRPTRRPAPTRPAPPVRRRPPCDRRAPHRHHRVTDELLHHPAVTVDHRPRRLEILRQQFPDLLGVPPTPTTE